MQVAKWGNSLAVRLPATVVEVLALKEGDDIEIVVADERRFEVQRKPTRAELLERLRAFRGRLPADFRFDRLDVHERDDRADPQSSMEWSGSIRVGNAAAADDQSSKPS